MTSDANKVKFLKPEISYLIKTIDHDISVVQRRINHTQKWIDDNKPTDQYHQKSVNASRKQIVFLEKLKSKFQK